MINYNSLVGLDIGSTTAKIVVTSSDGNTLLHSNYIRHDTYQMKAAASLLEEAHHIFPNNTFSVAVCGSGGEPIAHAIEAFFIQEVNALSTVVSHLFPSVRTAIEVGGQDAKVITFAPSKEDNQVEPYAMRMNGVCAGGTGAFIDQIASLLDIPVERFNVFAKKGTHVYDVSGRCGVFAKTDIQPLLNAGASRENLALSCFHAIARQTIGGLAQGLKLESDILFAGGPFTFQPRLVDVFKEKLSLHQNEVIRPTQPQLLVAYGAALSSIGVFMDCENKYTPNKIANLHQKRSMNISFSNTHSAPLFRTLEERKAFYKQHASINYIHTKKKKPSLKEERVWLGVDAGSTTNKFVLLNHENQIVHLFYQNNHGDPLSSFFSGFRKYIETQESYGITTRLAGIGVTGYGSRLFERALEAEHRSVETVAHAHAAQHIFPGVSSIIDIGGQDMKVIFMEDGVVSDIIINEACSAGCGSFLESYANSLDVPVDQVAEMAFQSVDPAVLGSRCTVFMNSAVITEQKKGKTKEDILAGLVKSVIENVFSKVVRPHNLSRLGENIVVQGGTFHNDAVLRAAEHYLDKSVFRPPYPGHMGAFGAALLAKHKSSINYNPTEHLREAEIQRVKSLTSCTYHRDSAPPCQLCANHCARSVVYFSHGSHYISGNRCERGAEIELQKKTSVSRSSQSQKKKPLNMLEVRRKALFSNYSVEPLLPSQNYTIGFPRVLEMWETAPFWSTFFRALGFRIAFSPLSTQKQYEQGLPFVSSDTVCLPAKLAHGHIETLIDNGVDAIFLPQMIYGNYGENKTEQGYFCALLQGYSMVLDNMHESHLRDTQLLHPIFHWFNTRTKLTQIQDFIHSHFSIDKKLVRDAVEQAETAMRTFRKTLIEAGTETLQQLQQSGKFGIVCASRPYHADRFINRDISRSFIELDIPILIPEALPEFHQQDLSDSRMEDTILYHNRMIQSAMATAQHPELELMQIVSFGCGHDAVISDEICRVLHERSTKTPLILKLDEGSADGPLQLRIESFIETIKQKRYRLNNTEQGSPQGHDHHRPPFTVRFTHKEKNKKEIYVPNLSPAFSKMMSAVISRRGFRLKALPAAQERAVQLGKRYVHNDMCFPAQVNIGEFLAEIEAGHIDPDTAALGIAKNCEACRAGQYAVVARKALDDAGYPDIPIVTTGKDTKSIHPAFHLTIGDQLKLLWGITIIDEMERMRRRVRPYEVRKGDSDAIFESYLETLLSSILISTHESLSVLQEAVDAFNRIPLHAVTRRPRVGITGEILMNYHPTANLNIERYLEKHGMEVVIPDLHLFFRKNSYIDKEMARRAWSRKPLQEYLFHKLSGKIYDNVRKKVVAVGTKFQYSEPVTWIEDISLAVEGIIDPTYRGAEGWKLPGEILTMADEGVRSFVVVQPFGCLPNHVTGRGFEKVVKQKKPHTQIVSLDFEPDTSQANIENRLQMLIMREKMWRKNAKKQTKRPKKRASA